MKSIESRKNRIALVKLSIAHSSICKAEGVSTNYKDIRHNMTEAEAGNAINKINARLFPAVSNTSQIDVSNEVAKQLAPVIATLPTKDDVSSAVRKAINALAGTGKANNRLPLIAAAASGNPMADALLKHYSPGVHQPYPLAIYSPPSFGKSYAIRALGAQYDLCLEHGCCNNPDEWEMLIGGSVPCGKSGFLMADGKIASACRAASEGKTVLLLLDEVLRWPEKVQEALLLFLQPVKNSKGAMVFRAVGRQIDLKTGAFEILEAPVEKLHIVAAANLTNACPVEAFWSRFQHKRFNFTVGFAIGHATMMAQSFGIADHEKLGRNFGTLMAKTREANVADTIKMSVCFRFFERSCAKSDGTAKGVAEIIASELPDHCCHWDADTGDTNTESLAVVTQMANEFKLLFAI